MVKKLMKSVKITAYKATPVEEDSKIVNFNMSKEVKTLMTGMCFGKNISFLR